MKTSDALRLADQMGLPGSRRQYIKVRSEFWEGEKPHCCAIGGAAIASGHQVELDPRGYVRHPDKFQTPLTDDWDFLMSFRARHPLDPRSWPVCREAIIDLYDNHGWSRTQIADWLDTAQFIKDADVPI